MNISTLQPPQQTQAIASTSKAQEKNADFLSLRLLNKRIRVRLSPDPLDLSSVVGRGTFFAVATSKGWFAAVTRNAGAHQLIFSPLNELRLAIATSTADDGEVPFTPKRTLALTPPNATPTHITFAFRDGRLVVGCAEGAVLIYDTRQLLSAGNEGVEPLRTLPPSSTGSIRQVLANPEDISELVAIRRDINGSTDAPAVEIVDVSMLEIVGGWRSGGSPGTTPTSMSWSPKGKQLALGLQSGEIVTFAPSNPSSPKSLIPAPVGSNTHATISLTWLSNPAFLAIYASTGQVHDPNVDQRHFVVLHDSKNPSGDSATEFSAPYFPSPGLRPPGAFCTVLRNWGNSRFIIFVGDGTSGDIGAVGCLADQQQESWHNLTLEETSTPSLPLDKELEDTVLLGLDLDTTYTQTQDSNGHQPSPVLLAYVSDGTVQAWYVSQKDAGVYGGMHQVDVNNVTSSPNPMQAFSAALAETTQPVSTFGTTGFGFGSHSSGAFGQPQPQPTQSPFSQAAQKPQPTFGQSGFGQSSFGQASQGATSTFGQPSAFGQSSFGQTSMPAFGQSSMPAASAFGSSATPAQSGGAFGSFASQSPATFGTSGFGFAANATQPTQQPQGVPSPPDNAASPEAEMSDAADEGDLGGLSLNAMSGLSEGGSGSGSQTPGRNNMFGSFGSTTTQNTEQASSSGSTSSFLKPAAGFGAFANPTSTSPFAAAAAGSVKPSSGFGAFSNLGSTTSAFGSAATTPSAAGTSANSPSPAFGTSSFGAKPAFGQSAFGQSSFGQSAFGKSGFGAATPTTLSPSAFGGSGGGFAAFASGGSGGFSSVVKSESAPSVKAESQELPKAKEEDTSGGKTGQSALGQSSFGRSTFGQSGFGTTPAATSISSASAFGGNGGGGFAAFSGGNGGFGPTMKSESAPVVKTEPEDAPKVKVEDTSDTLNAFGLGATSSFSTDRQLKSEATNVFGVIKTEPSPSSSLAPPPMAPKSSSAMSISESISTSRTIKTPESSPEGSPTATERKLDRIDELTRMSPDAEDATGSPTQTQAQVKSQFSASPFGQSATSTTPASSPFRSTAPSPGFGAFANLKSTPSPFGSSVFGSGTSAFGAGAFGSSVFANPKPPAVSAFGGSASTTPTKPPVTGSASTTPTFGSSSALGTTVFGKSSFGAPAPVSAFATPTKAPSTTPATTSAFGAYSASGLGGFGAGVTKQTSFKDLLKTEKDAPAKTGTSSVTTAPSSADGSAKTILKVDETTTQAKSLKDVAGESSYIDVPSNTLEEIDDENLPPTPSTHGTFDDEEDEARRNESGEIVVHDDTAGFLSDSFSESDDIHDDEDDDDDADGDEDEEEEDGYFEEEAQPLQTKSASPASIPLPPTPKIQDSTPRASPTPPPLSRGSSTDKETTPKNQISSPPAVAEARVKIDVESTTPPGSPEKTEPAPTSSSIFAPKMPSPTSSSSSSSSSSPSSAIGLGRPATRPMRSSPLAGTPVVPEPVKAVPSISQGPPVIKPRPASPKLPFGQLPPMLKAEPTTPVLIKGPETSPFKLNTPGTSIFMQQPATPVKSPPSTSSATGSSLGMFAAFKYPATPQQPPMLSAAAQSLTSPSAPFIFPGAAPMQPPMANAVPQPSPSAVFTPRPAPPVGWGTPTMPAHHTAAPQGLQPPSFQAQAQTHPPQMQTRFESEMQQRCFELYVHVSNELLELQKLAQAASVMRERRQSAMTTPSAQGAVPETPVRPGVDFEAFKKRTAQLMDGINEAGDFSKSLSSGIRELESNLLKAETKKEEIVRFSRAKEDPEFAKMLKVRTLGPEASETQGQLRRQIRTINDRVEQLENHLRSCKKRLDEHRRGKPSFKAPSLDTISRTYRNIDLAIEHQTSQISALSERVSRLKLLDEAPTYSPRRSLGSRNGSLNGSFSGNDTLPSARRGGQEDRTAREVTPSVAACTAAALNAERSAQRLKVALSKIRKEPLLNTQALNPSKPVPTLESLRTRRAYRVNPQVDKHANASNASNTSFAATTPGLPSTPLRLSSASLFGSDPTPLTPSPLFNNSSPDASSTPPGSGSGVRRNALPHAHDRPGRHAAHARPVPLKRAASATPLEEEEARGFGGTGTGSTNGSGTGQGLGFGLGAGAGAGTTSGAGKATVSFDWGPLPKAAPRTQISSDVRPSVGLPKR